MSDREWRFTDDQGVERSGSTDELREALRSGKVSPSTLVWTQGMEEFLPAAKVPELSAAGLRPAPRPPSSLGKSSPPRAPSNAPGKRSVPPPLPPRKRERQTYKTLTGLEPPELIESLGLNKKPEQKERRMSASDLPALTEEGGWEDETDLIPKAPGLPKIKGATPQLTPLSLPEVPAEPLSPTGTDRTTLLGFGKKPGAPSVPPGKPQLRPPIRAPRTSPAEELTAVGSEASRSKPPPAPKRSQPPPSASPKRLSQTLEMEIPQERSAATRPQPKPRPVPPLLNRTGENVAAPVLTRTGEVQAPRKESGGDRAKPPPPPRNRTTERPASQTDVQEVPQPAAAADPSATEERVKATTLMSGTPSAVAEAVAAAARPPPSRTIEMQRHHTDVLPKVDATPAPPTASSQQLGQGGEAAPQATPPVPVVDAPASELVAAAASEPAIREVEPEAAPAPRRVMHRTLEMAVDDHEVASMKDPAPPESLKPAALAEGAPLEGEDPVDDQGSAASIGRARRIEIPKRSIIVVSAAWVVGLIIFFAAGMLSGRNSSADAPVIRPMLEMEFLRITPSEAGSQPVIAEPKPCWVTRQPSKWAPKADKSVSFGRRVADGVMELGFAVDSRKAVGLRVDPKTGKAETVFEKSTSEDVTRVAPMTPTGAEPVFLVSEKGAPEVLAVHEPKPSFIAFGESGISRGVDGTTFDTKLWDLPGEGSTAAEQTVMVGDRTLLAFRRSNKLFTGFIGPDGTSMGELSVVSVADGATAGKPRAATNGEEIAVVFVEKADDKDETPWELRLAKSKADALPTTAAPLALPEGGPGGNAIAPDIVGLPDGRWLLMWTEGPFESSAIRAQTYTKAMEPIGDPIALSPPAGNFGQALLTVVGDYTTVVFLQAVNDDDFELWGAVLRCG